VEKLKVKAPARVTPRAPKEAKVEARVTPRVAMAKVEARAIPKVEKAKARVEAKAEKGTARELCKSTGFFCTIAKVNLTIIILFIFVIAVKKLANSLGRVE